MAETKLSESQASRRIYWKRFRTINGISSTVTKSETKTPPKAQERGPERKTVSANCFQGIKIRMENIVYLNSF